MKLVLFDCDGTLVESAALIHAVMEQTFEHFGYARPSMAQTKATIGLTLDIAIARIQGKEHADEEAVKMMAYYKSIFMSVRATGKYPETMFDGIADLIARLVARDDVLIGAVTGKSRRGLEGTLENNRIRSHFIVSRTADDCPSKPHPAMVSECCDETGMTPAQTVVIGDAVYDMQMAKSAGAKALGVSWGYGSVEDLLKAGADRIATRPADLYDMIF